MHYKDGTEAKLFDLCSFPLAQSADGKMTQRGIGIVQSISPGSGSCNAQVMKVAAEVALASGDVVRLPSPAFWAETVTLGDCFKLAALEPAPAAAVPAPEAPKPA